MPSPLWGLGGNAPHPRIDTHAIATDIRQRPGQGRARYAAQRVQTMYDRDYALTTKATGTFTDVVARVRDALKAEGFGVLTEIDIQATLKNKIGVDRKPYLILGACNPQLAHRALTHEAPLGVFLPCNVDVFEGDDGSIYVQTPKPTVMFGLVNSADVAPIATEVESRLTRVLATLA